MDDLAKRLRERSVFLFPHHGESRSYDADLMREAADAIEELSAAVEGYESSTNMAVVEKDGKTVIKFEPKWIPVTERLPEILHKVIVSGRMKYKWETDYFRFVDLATFREWELFETFNDWYEGQDEFEITHWMPLPEPPKEGET